ncbi:sulfite oxidase [Sphingomonas sp. 1P08PE]|uniref:sulfite oxidase n=1 Tax=Sphingomonas sp. 1P08PE TaxID=554122 RepID=UPI00399EE943
MTPLARAEQNLIVRGADPLNAEAKPARLMANFLTSQADFYVRSHGPLPDLGNEHAVVVDGLVDTPLRLTLASLRDQFVERSVVSVMQCAGNRRAEFQPVRPTKGDPWNIGAIGNAEWTGVALADVLAGAGVRQEARHVAFTAADQVEVEGETAPYGASIPLDKALEPDVLIVWAMNGDMLRPEHGAPLRMVVPGYAGVRSPKWLTRIELRATASEAPIQAKDYKLFPASVTADEADWEQGITINEMPLNAAICEPQDGGEVPAGRRMIRGYAVASGRGIGRVEVSVDGGDWLQARVHREENAPRAWTQWQVEAELLPGRHRLTVRAIDEAGQGQPERPDDLWNFAGYLSTAWHRVTVTAA